MIRWHKNHIFRVKPFTITDGCELGTNEANFNGAYKLTKTFVLINIDVRSELSVERPVELSYQMMAQHGFLAELIWSEFICYANRSA
eukprot:1195076-Prorocentrum_minimum.AAC.4